MSEHPGTTWLASCSPSPGAVRSAWKAGELAAVPATEWRAVEAPLLRSVDAMQVLGRAKRLGPVLAWAEASVVWWLVADGAEEHLVDLPLLILRPPLWPLRCPPAHEYLCGRIWLEKPDGSGLLTDPVDLGAAFSRGGSLAGGVYR
ncbi:hypothetical protein [Streptomyces sp. NPDC051173]|uniref:hypothetical protein n=1 Tax=Streptomyces sp. NPDC051173 TaxID=3155164 RepID=UPI00344D25E3